MLRLQGLLVLPRLALVEAEEAPAYAALAGELLRLTASECASRPVEFRLSEAYTRSFAICE